jgi:hypothetical protein
LILAACCYGTGGGDFSAHPGQPKYQDETASEMSNSHEKSDACLPCYPAINNLL